MMAWPMITMEQWFLLIIFFSKKKQILASDNLEWASNTT